MEKLTQNEIKRPPGTLQTHPLEIQKACLRKGRQRGHKWIILGAKRRQQTHSEIVINSVSKKLQSQWQKYTKFTPTLVHDIIIKRCNKLQRNMARHLWKNMCLRRGKTCKRNVNLSVFLGGGRRLDVEPWKSTNILQQINKHPCKMDYKSMHNRCPKKWCNQHGKWRQNGGRNSSKIYEQLYKTTSRKMKRPKAMGPKGR